MAIELRRGLFLPSLSLVSRLCYLSLELQRWMHTSSGKTRSEFEVSEVSRDQVDTSIWKTLDSRRVGINKSVISFPTWKVLKVLRDKGFDAYLVGGCVRDLLLKRAPKDFDIITSATLKQVKKNFYRSRVVGRQFPICHIHIGHSIVEVSSFSTKHKNAKKRQTVPSSQIPSNCDKKDVARWKNSMDRDFTINGLFYDPFVHTIYDYVDGIMDLRTSKVRTVIPAHISFKEDTARILRGLRIAARLGLKFSKETADAILDLSSSIITLDKSRLMLELNFMLAYGAAESSIQLLQKFNLLEILLPFHAAYLADQTKNQSGRSSSMLMKLFSNIDRLLAADRPSDYSLWLGLLAFHVALVEHPQDATVIWTFSSILYHGTWSKALKSKREVVRLRVEFVPEVLVPSGTKPDESLLEEVSRLASLVKSSIRPLSSTDALQQALARYPKTSPCLGLVLISEKMANSVARLFDVLETDLKSYSKERETYDIDFQLLKKGNPDETRFVLGKVIMDTLNGALNYEPNQDLNVGKRQPLLSQLFK